MIASDHHEEGLSRRKPASFFGKHLSFLASPKSTGLLQINTNYEITNWWR